MEEISACAGGIRITDPTKFGFLGLGYRCGRLSSARPMTRGTRVRTLRQKSLILCLGGLIVRTTDKESQAETNQNEACKKQPCVPYRKG